MSLGITTYPVTAALVDANSFHQPAANTAAVCTLPAVEGKSRHIGQILLSYDDDPTGGEIKVEEYNAAGDTVERTIIKHAVTSGGLGPWLFAPTIKFTANRKVVVTLAAGGSGVSGALFVNHWLGA